MGHQLPRHLNASAAALPQIAAAPTVRHRGSYGPIRIVCTAKKAQILAASNEPSFATSVLGAAMVGCAM
jgi:hypothetical protein